MVCGAPPSTLPPFTWQAGTMGERVSDFLLENGVRYTRIRSCKRIWSGLGLEKPQDAQVIPFEKISNTEINCLSVRSAPFVLSPAPLL